MKKLISFMCLIPGCILVVVMFYYISDFYFSSPEIYKENFKSYYSYLNEALDVFFSLYIFLVSGMHLLIFIILMMFRSNGRRLFCMGIFGLFYFPIRVMLVNHLGYIYFPIAILELYGLKNLMHFIESGHFKFTSKETN